LSQNELVKIIISYLIFKNSLIGVVLIVFVDVNVLSQFMIFQRTNLFMSIRNRRY